MPGETPIVVTPPVAAKKVTVVNPPPLPFSPIAYRSGVKTRATIVKTIAELAPAGTPDPALVAVAKATVQQLIETKFPEATGFDVLIETNAGPAAQLMVLVIPHEL